jgi:hypothetical protein
VEPARHNQPNKILVSDEFERLLGDSSKAPWWTAFLDMIYQRRNLKLNELLLGAHDDNQRTEDRLKGAIQELNFILALGQRGDSISVAMEHEDRHGAEIRAPRI